MYPIDFIKDTRIEFRCDYPVFLQVSSHFSAFVRVATRNEATDEIIFEFDWVRLGYFASKLGGSMYESRN